MVKTEMAVIHGSGDHFTAHIPDLDLLFADQASPAVMKQSQNESICRVALGLVREGLFWRPARNTTWREVPVAPGVRKPLNSRSRQGYEQ